MKNLVKKTVLALIVLTSIIFVSCTELNNYEEQNIDKEEIKDSDI